MSNYVSEILPRLKALACGSEQDGRRVAHVQALPTNDDTPLVADLWRHAKSADPERQAVCIYQSDIEVQFAAYVPNSDRFELYPDEPRSILLFVSYEGFQKQQLDARPDAAPLADNALVFVNVEAEPSAAGEMFLASFLRWALEPNNRRPVVLLSRGARDDVRHVLAQVAGAETLELRYTGPSPPPQLLEVESELQLWQLVKEVLLEASHAGQGEEETDEQKPAPGPCALAFMDHARVVRGIADPISTETGTRLLVYQLPEDARLEDINAAARSARPKIICLDAALRYPGGFPNVRLALSDGSRYMPAFDAPTGQFMAGPVAISRTQIELQWEWLLQCEMASGFSRVLYTNWPTETYGQLSAANLDAVKGQLMPVCLWLYGKFPNIGPAHVPMPSLSRIEAAQITEVNRRLRLMRCLEPISRGAAPLAAAPASPPLAAGALGQGAAPDRPRQWRRTLLGIRTLQYTWNRAYNPGQDIHLGNLLAQAADYRGKTARTVRVLCRLAGAIQSESLLCWLPDGTARFDSEDDSFLPTLQSHCVGIGQQQAASGMLWLKVGVWAKLRGQPPPQASAYHPLVDDQVYADMRAVRAMTAYVQLLEARFNLLASEPTDEHSLLLDDQELDQVLSALMWAYLPRMAFFPAPPARAQPLDMVTLKPVQVLEALVPWRQIREQLSQGLPGGFVAVYTSPCFDSRSPDHGFACHNLTLLPNRLFQEVLTHFSETALSKIVCS